jgi:hypothetical protein
MLEWLAIILIAGVAVLALVRYLRFRDRLRQELTSTVAVPGNHNPRLKSTSRSSV